MRYRPSLSRLGRYSFKRFCLSKTDRSTKSHWRRHALRFPARARRRDDRVRQRCFVATLRFWLSELNYRNLLLADLVLSEAETSNRTPIAAIIAPQQCASRCVPAANGMCPADGQSNCIQHHGRHEEASSISHRAEAACGSSVPWLNDRARAARNNASDLMGTNAACRRSVIEFSGRKWRASQNKTANTYVIVLTLNSVSVLRSHVWTAPPRWQGGLLDD